MNKNERKLKVAELNADPYFQRILNLLSDEEQKKKIKIYVEDVYINLLQHGTTVALKIKENPEMLAKVVAEEVSKNSGSNIIKDK